MSKSDIAIVIDSTANVPDEYIKKYGFHIVPLRVNWPGETVESQEDLKEITPTEFFERVQKTREIPTTSQPSPGEFVEFFSRIGKETKNIVAVLVSDKLSGTFKSAQFALNMVEDLNIELVDSKSGGMGMALIAFHAAQAIEEGKGLHEVAQSAREAAEVARTWFVVDTLEFLHKGGRVSGTRKMIGTILDMKPLLHVIDGAPELFGTVRNINKAVDTMLDLVEVELKNKRNIKVGISHAINPEMAAYADAEIRKRINPSVLITNEFSPVFATHLGPRALGIAHLAEG